MKITINSVFGAILFEGDFSCLADAVTAAIKANANLSSANLSYADLSSANLSYADLRSANLSYADLRSANLSSANLSYANLSVVKFDFWAVLTCAKNEVAGLRLALVEGRVNGSSYTGECACLVGTLANVRHCSYDALKTVAPDAERPAERFFLGIKTGDTPKKNQFAKLAVDWIDEWAALLEIDVTKQAAKTGAV